MVIFSGESQDEDNRCKGIHRRTR